MLKASGTEPCKVLVGIQSVLNWSCDHVVLLLNRNFWTFHFEKGLSEHVKRTTTCFPLNILRESPNML